MGMADYMEMAEHGDTVRVHYTGRLENGMVFDSSLDREPLQFTIGAGQLIPGFEAAVVGLSPGDTTSAIIAPEEAYGAHREELIIHLRRDELPDDVEPEVGERMESEQEDGEMVMFTVVVVSESIVTLDGNHPLAGKTLEFDIELVDIC